jgi:release factor glutamine methyltransferase
LSAQELLAHAAKEEGKHLEELFKRYQAGLPAPYAAGFFYFRGRRFQIDQRAYITDPEAAYLVDAVAACGKHFAKTAQRDPVIAEFGVGAGTLAISLGLENPGFCMSGFDIDAPALEVARINAQLHQSQIHLFQSDYFQEWRKPNPPDILFADPPWGSREDLYEDERSAHYYDQMPELAAYPKGGRIGIHEGIIHELQRIRWPSLLVMNFGVIPHILIKKLLPAFSDYTLYHPQGELTILAGYVKLN